MTRPRRSRAPAVALTLGPAALLLSACAGPLNNEATLGDPLRSSQLVVSPSIGPGDPEPKKGERMVLSPRDSADERPEAEVLDDGPSLTSLSREHWSSTRIVVPNDRVAHQPRYTHEKIYNRTNARTRGDFPSAASALDTTTARGSDMQIKEAVAAPFAAGIDIALFPFRAVAARPWQRTRSGLESYQRAPQERFSIPEGLRPVEPQEPAKPEADAKPKPSADTKTKTDGAGQ